MLFSEIGTWFMLVGGAQIPRFFHLTQITDFNQVSLVLRPILGPGAYLIFSLGIIGVGAIAIPTMAGSIGYMAAEIFDWPEGINKRVREAKWFYATIVLAMLSGLALNLLNLNPVELLIYTAVLYTIITPPIIYLLIRMANNKKIVGEQTTTPAVNVLGYVTLFVMLAAAIGYLFTL